MRVVDLDRDMRDVIVYWNRAAEERLPLSCPPGQIRSWRNPEAESTRSGLRTKM